MDFFKSLKNASNKKQSKSTVNIADTKKQKTFILKILSSLTKSALKREGMDYPEFDLEEIKKATESDSYIKIAHLRYSDLLFKAGYELRSENDEAVDYIESRFRMMEFASKQPMSVLFQEVGDDLLKYSNAFIAKIRVDKIPGINAKPILGGTKVVGGYFRLDPTTVHIERSKSGAIKYYIQGYGSEEIKYLPSDILHIYSDRDGSNSFGTPRYWAALEDVKLLRRIEGNVVSLIYRFAIPIYQWIVGLPERGFEASDTEIREAQAEIQGMDLDGIIITNERTQIKTVGAEGVALDATGYMSYFEKRVFTALGVSDALMGRDSSKSNADTMEAQVHNAIKKTEAILSAFFEVGLLTELLLEGGYNPIANKNDIVKYVFNEISLDTKIKVENHELLKYQSNLNTFTEARHAVGRKCKVDEEELYANFIDAKVAKDQIEAQKSATIDISDVTAKHQENLAKVNASLAPKTTSANVSGNGKPKSSSSAAKKDVKSRANPHNQHGTTNAKIKESYEPERNLTKHVEKYSNIYKLYRDCINDLKKENADIDIILGLSEDALVRKINTILDGASLSAINDATKEISEIEDRYIILPNKTVPITRFQDKSEKSIRALYKDIKKRLKAEESTEYYEEIFSSLEYRLRFLLEYIVPKTYWFSYIKTGDFNNIRTAYIDFGDSDDSKDHPKEISTKSFDENNIPAYHSFCDCKVTFKKIK